MGHEKINEITQQHRRDNLKPLDGLEILFQEHILEQDLDDAEDKQIAAK